MSVGCDACLPDIRKYSQYGLQEQGIKTQYYLLSN